jgi:hypothetical protein
LEELLRKGREEVNRQEGIKEKNSQRGIKENREGAPQGEALTRKAERGRLRRREAGGW